MSYRCSFRDIQRSKRPKTINFLFQILLFYFEELNKKFFFFLNEKGWKGKKILLQDIVHKTDKTDKKLNHLSFQSTEHLNKNMGIKRDKSGKSSSQTVPRIWNSRLMNYKVSGGGIFIDWDIEGSLFVWFYYVFRLYSS
jgi:hypothetical protein